MKKLTNKEKIYSIGCILLMIDQGLKLLVKAKVPLLDEITVIPNFFSIYHMENKGAAFSMFGGATIFLIVISFLVLLFLDRYVLIEKEMTKWRIFSLGIIIGGVVGNLIDRIFYGAVVDFLAFDIFGYGFPVFNIADIGITLGFLTLAVGIIRRDSNERRSEIRGRGNKD